MRRSGLLFICGLWHSLLLPVEVWAVSQDDFPKYEQVSYGQLRLALKRSSRSIELVMQGVAHVLRLRVAWLEVLGKGC